MAPFTPPDSGIDYLSLGCKISGVSTKSVFKNFISMNIIKLLVVFMFTEARSLSRSRRDLSSTNRMANNVFMQELAMQNGHSNQINRQRRRFYYQQLYKHFQKNPKNNVEILIHLESELKNL